MDDTLDTNRRFAALIESTLKLNLAKGKSDLPHSSGTVSMQSGLIFPRAVVHIPQIRVVIPAVGKVIDGAGHDRPPYRGLLVYSWLRAMEIEKLGRNHELARWCDLLEADLTSPADEPRSQTGWNALALHLAATALGRGDWSILSARTFHQLADEQQASGPLFPHAPDVNPETRWYDELTLLHAMSSYAVATKDRRIMSAVHRATDFHLLETQPDHATQQPWALFAFLSNPGTRILGEEILHTATMRNPENLDAISLILLADALWGLKLSIDTKREGTRKDRS